MQRIYDELQNNPGDILGILAGSDNSQITLDHILKALGSGNSYVCDIVEEAGTHLGYAIANMATSLDIGIVIIGGDIVKLEHYILKPIRETVALISSATPTIIPSTLGEDVALWGASLVGWEHVVRELAEQR
jgi:glucokinase